MKTLLTLSLVISLALPMTVRADHEDREERQLSYGYARVIRVEPIIRYVEVEEPEENCSREEIHSYREGRNTNVAGATIFGGVLGGLIGSQVGRGNGRVATTIAGSMIGAAVGNGAAQNSRRGYDEVRHIRRCREERRVHQEERVEGYWVDYEYRGDIYHTRLSYRPGNTIRVRITVDPVAP